jgi:hypothetical protein
MPRHASLGAPFAALAALLLMAPTATAHCLMFIHDDDGSSEAEIEVDYFDDLAVKRLVVTPTQAALATAATLNVYAKSNACTGATNLPHHLYANGHLVARFNACNDWTGTYAYRSYSIPVEWIVPGINSFEFTDEDGSYTHSKMRFGIDQHTDLGRTDAVWNGGDHEGEFLWELVLRSESVCV